jgi:hypothetical protein
MQKVSEKEVAKYIETHIQDFHRARWESLLKLRLSDILKKKNAYLLRAKNVVSAPEYVKTLLDAHLSSQEETIFGNFLEGLAIFICEKVFKGFKSSAEGIDLEFEKDKVRYIVTIKSGPNWGNSSQVKKMREDFRQAKRILGQQLKDKSIMAVNGCCYGKDNKPDKGDYLKLCGQRLWQFISDDENLYLRIIKPLGHTAKERNEEFLEEYAKVVNLFTLQFLKTYCEPDGSINWNLILQKYSGMKNSTVY